MNNPATPATQCVVIQNPTGLHARPAVKVSKLAKTFAAEVQLSVSGGETWVNAKSTHAVMKLKAGNGAQLLIRAEGADADSAVAGIATLVRQDFHGA